VFGGKVKVKSKIRERKIAKTGEHTFSKKNFKNDLKNLDTNSKFHTKDPEVLGVSLQNAAAMATFVHPCAKIRTKTENISVT
jgi:hypothetical protein